MIASCRAWFIVLCLIVMTLPLIPLQWFFNKTNNPLRRKLPLLWHRMAAGLVGLRVHVRGEMSAQRPLLLTANHVSWLDIVAFGVTGPISFIAKQEVSKWPAFGMLAKLQRTVFINREKRIVTGDKTSEIAKRLNEGDAMVLFAEGTSTSGVHVKPFRSALLGAVQKAAGSGETIHVQPVAIAYTHISGMPAFIDERDFTGFYGDMDLVSSLWPILKEGAIDVTICFGDPIIADKTTDRKQLSLALEERVRALKSDAFAIKT